jgi:hypothetical protein
LEAKIVTLRKDIQKKNMQNISKVLDDIINSQKSHLDKSRLGYNQKKRDQAPKQQSKKQIQKSMQKQSKGIGRLQGHSSTKKIQISKSTIDK